MASTHLASTRTRLTCVLSGLLLLHGCAGMPGVPSTDPNVNVSAKGPGKNGNAQQPTITGFSPTSGSVGQAVRIDGTNFTDNTEVFFNGTEAEVTLISSTQLTAVVPAGATTGPINVINGNLVATSTTPFTVVAVQLPPPVLGTFSPTSGLPGTTVLVQGTGFSDILENNVVRFNGVPAALLPGSTTNLLLAVVPAGATSGPISVTVGANAPVTTSASFSVATSAEPVPSIGAVTPPSGAAGASVTVMGINFTPNSVVSFNGVPAATTFDSATQLKAVVPAGATTGPVKVENRTADGAAGPAALGPTFTVVSGVPFPASVYYPMLNASPGEIVQLRPDRMRIEVSADTGPTGACVAPPPYPTVQALFDQLTASHASFKPELGLRGHAAVYLQRGEERGESIVPMLSPEGTTIDVPDMVVPPDETEVAVGNDRAGHVLEVIWLPVLEGSLFPQSPPIVRVELVDWNRTLATSGQKLIVDWDLQTYDKRTGKTLEQWNGTVKNVEVP